MKKRINTAPPRTFKVAKLYLETHQKVADLMTGISRRGWEGLGVDRGDVPTVSAVIDAAVDLLVERSQQAGTKGKKG